MASYTLRVFGGLSLHGPGGIVTGAAAQRRKLALLAMLSVAGERGSSRDRLVAVLWPDSDTERARHVLTQTLSALRKELGEATAVRGSADLRLDPAVLGSDLGEHEARLARGDREGALELYTGPFLDGVHLTDAPEFERWVDEHRARYHRRIVDLLESMAQEASGDANHGVAVRWWRQRAALDPLDSAVAHAYMLSLVSAGDRAGAITHAQVHADLLREELGAQADRSIRELAERLRSGADVMAPPAKSRTPAIDRSERGWPLTADARRVLANRYAIERELGRTAMTTAYLATSLADRRQVQLKALSPAVATVFEPPTALRELRQLTRIRHERLVPIVDADSSAGIVFYVEPKVDGDSLRARLNREGPLPIDQALEIAIQISEALTGAHAQSVLHLDVKPRTILLTDAGAMLTDTGVSWVMRKLSTTTDGATAIAVGSPPYMSPEQAAGENRLDVRSDIYSLGCVLYEMLAGEAPFTGRSAAAVLAKRWTHPVPRLATARPTVTPALENVIQRALERTPADRFTDATELRNALSAL